MPRKTKSSTVWNAGTLVNIFTIPILTGAITFMGFFYTTKNELAEHTVQINKENEARDKLRDALLTEADATQKALSSLTANAMVQSEQIKSINNTLDRVVGGLQLLGNKK